MCNATQNMWAARTVTNPTCVHGGPNVYTGVGCISFGNQLHLFNLRPGWRAPQVEPLRPGDLRPGDLRPGWRAPQVEPLRPGDLRPGDLRPGWRAINENNPQRT